MVIVGGKVKGGRRENPEEVVALEIKSDVGSAYLAPPHLRLLGT